MAGHTYRDLDAWQKSMDLVEEIYRITKDFPREEQFGLTNQIRRSATSVPANIAEGQGRLHRAEFLRLLSVARGSLTETETHLQIAVRLGYIDRDSAKEAWALSQRVGRQLTGLIKSLEGKNGGNSIRISETTESYGIEDTDLQ